MEDLEAFFLIIFIYDFGAIGGWFFCISADMNLLVLLLCCSYMFDGSAGGVIVIAVGNGYDDLSTNPGQDCLHFTLR